MKYSLGSRGSALALAQVELFQQRFQAVFPDDELELVVVKTTGDKKQETELAGVSDKREWIHELELGVASGELTAALHSGKDIPCVIDEETCLVPVLSRASPYDLFIGKKREDGRRISFPELQQGATIGTASLRRRAQLLRLRSDLTVKELRGNVQTRIRKLDEGQVDGIVLAAAGIERLSAVDVAGKPFLATELLPAVNQGMLAMQLRKDNRELFDKLQSLVSEEEAACFFAERTVAEVLDGDCRSAIGIYAEMLVDETLCLTAEVYAPDGSMALFCEREGSFLEPQEVGREVGEELLRMGALELLA